MKYIVLAVVSMVFWAVMFAIVAYIDTPTIVTGTDVGSMTVKGFLMALIGLAAIASPIVILAKAWHDKGENK